MGAYPYILVEIALIYFFSYFWTTVVFSPDDMAKQLRDNGHFIPGLRPGPRTAEYLCGREPTADTALGAATIARGEVAPISDVRGSADYKSLLLGQLVLAHFNALFGIEDGLVREAGA